MNGPEGAADRARGWLAARIPPQLRRIEQRLDLDPGSLADPAKVRAHEDGPLGLEDWPAVYVLPQRLDRLDLVEVRDDGAEVYRAVYATRVLVWVRADGYAATDQLRKRYALAIREALLERKTLATLEEVTVGVDDVVVDPASIREDYSDVFTDDASRTIAGAWVDVALITAEVLEAPPGVGTVDELDLGAAALPPHPAL